MKVSTLFYFSAAMVSAAALVACSGTIEQPASNPTTVDVSDEDFSYAMYNEVLKEFVDDKGHVDYAGLKANREPHDRFIALMGAVTESELASWSSDEQLAFWMNAYNAITLKYIIDHYPIEKGGLISRALYPANSIRQIPGVWDELTTPVAGSPITLDAIEHEILRVEFTEPRIHMAIVCAAMGCPPLRAEAFVGERIEEQLDDQSIRFLGHPDRFRIDRETGTVHLSSIFDWFGEDFVPVYSPANGTFSEHDETTAAVLNFVSGYIAETDAQYLKQQDYKVAFTKYDWSLNEQ